MDAVTTDTLQWHHIPQKWHADVGTWKTHGNTKFVSNFGGKKSHSERMRMDKGVVDP